MRETPCRCSARSDRTPGYAQSRSTKQHRIENRSANVFEVNIDAVRTGRFQSFAQLGLPVIETGVKSEFLLDDAAFLLTSGNPNGSVASLEV